MDDRRMLLLSILYRFVRCLLGLTTVLMRRDLSKDAELLVLRHENNCVAPPGRPGPLHARRPRVAGRPILALAASPRGRDFSGHSRHDPGLAPPVGLTEMGLHRTPPAWTSLDRCGDQEAGDADGTREPH